MSGRTSRPRPKSREHVPVLLEEVREALALRRGDIVADVTLGLAGHAVPLLKAVGKRGRLVGLDLDPENLTQAQLELAATGLRFDLQHANFAGLPRALATLGIDGVDALVADLGVSSTQIDQAARGFSYLRPARLDMRMDPTRGRTAGALLDEITEANLATALRELGDEPDAAAIARIIAMARLSRPVDTTSRLVSLVCQAKGIPVPSRGWGRLHPAALTFQAVRMLVNREMENLAALLAFLPSCLRPGGRVAVISFHSGEDRLVKTSFKEGRSQGLYSKIAEDPVLPGDAEQEANPRSWSARMRWAVRSGVR